jgi:hypothetical protein
MNEDFYAIDNLFFDIKSNDGSYFNNKLQDKFGCM